MHNKLFALLPLLLQATPGGTAASALGGSVVPTILFAISGGLCAVWILLRLFKRGGDDDGHGGGGQ